MQPQQGNQLSHWNQLWKTCSSSIWLPDCKVQKHFIEQFWIYTPPNKGGVKNENRKPYHQFPIECICGIYGGVIHLLNSQSWQCSQKNVFGRVWQYIWSRCTSLTPALYCHHGARPSHLQIPQQSLKWYRLDQESLQTESQAHFYHFYLKWQQIPSQTTLMINLRHYWTNVKMTF